VAAYRNSRHEALDIRSKPRFADFGRLSAQQRHDRAIVEGVGQASEVGDGVGLCDPQAFDDAVDLVVVRGGRRPAKSRADFVRERSQLGQVRWRLLDLTMVPS
jgi:hypothetical protein